VSNTVTVTVTNAPVPATSIAIKYNGRVLADNETVEMAVGSSITLEPTVEPSDASVTDSDFEWDVDPDTFHTQSGRNITITPSETGVYTITVTADSLGVRCRLNVVEREPEGIDVTDTSGNLSGHVSVQVGETVTLRASVTPANAAYSPSDIRWTVTAGNASLSATTGETVTVTGRSAGTVTVKASIGSYDTFYDIRVTAVPAPTPPRGRRRRRMQHRSRNGACTADHEHNPDVCQKKVIVIDLLQQRPARKAHSAPGPGLLIS